MKANYHTHTARCNHAVGSEREYVEAAIQSGLKVLGFSDHTPYNFPNGYVSGIRMGMHELENYVDTVLALRREYRNDIDIHLGLEVEYYPVSFPELLKIASDYPIEYFLLAQHFLENEAGEAYCGRRTDQPQILIRYCDQIEDAMSTGRFTYLAHPDLIHFTGSQTLYEQHMRRLCQSAKKYHCPLELNFLGLEDGRHYPNESFWKIAGEEGCDVIFGIDAHTPAAFEFANALQQARQMVQRHRLNLLEDVNLINPF